MDMLTILIRFIITVSLLLAGQAQAQTVYRLWLGNRSWSPRLVGVAGTGAAGDTLAGAYDTKWGAFEFLITHTGGYQLEIDKTGSGVYTEDTDWDAGQTYGKFIPGTDYAFNQLHAFPDSLRIYATNYDADLWLVNIAGDSANIWMEGASTYTGLPGYGLYIGHPAGGHLALGAASGLFEDTRVVVRGEQFEVRPRADQDSVFVVQADSADQVCQVRVTGEMIVGPDADGDGEVWFKNSDGDLGLVDMDHTGRYLAIEHAKTGGQYGALAGMDGRNGDWRVLGDLSVRATIEGDSLFSVIIDSTAGTADINLVGQIHVGPDIDGDGEVWFVNGASDSALVDMDYNGRYFAIQHDETGSAYGSLSGRNGRQGDWRVVGDLTGRATIVGDSLWALSVDSSNGLAGLYLNGHAKVSSIAAVAYDTLASAATITLSDTNNVVITGTADIDSMDTASTLVDGQIVYIVFSGTAGSTGVIDGKNLALAGNFTYSPNDMLVLQRRGSTLIEISRSAN